MAKIKDIIGGAEQLSLGISMVVAIVLGVLLGIFMRNLTGLNFLFWVGFIIGIAAAILNVFKAYKLGIKELDKLKDENRYLDIDKKEQGGN